MHQLSPTFTIHTCILHVLCTQDTCKYVTVTVGLHVHVHKKWRE